MRGLLEANRDVHALAVNITVFEYNITKIDADLKMQLFVLWRATSLGKSVLHTDRTFNRVNNAVEGRQRAVARQLNDPTTPFFNRHAQEFFEQRL